MTDTAITTVARHHVPVEKEVHFADWASGIDAASRRFSGYLGMDVIHSHGENDRESYCMFKFDNEANLDVWMTSNERKRWLKDPRSCSDDQADIRSFHSLGFWFASDDHPGVLPSDHKMALVTLAVIWPMVHFISPMTAKFVGIPWVAEFASVAIIVVLMTYVVMPLATRLLGAWLYR